VASNFVFGWSMSGPDRSARPDSEIDLKVSREIVKGISFGPEYYADFGPLARVSPFAEQEQTLFAAFDVDLKPFVFNLGLGRGVTHAADRWTLKAIFEIPF
jgi:hypothetical protein